MNLASAELQQRYDKLACAWLSLPSLVRLPGGRLEFAQREFFDAGKLASMRQNFVGAGGGRVVPKPCDVLSAYIKLRDDALARVCESICDEIANALPAGDEYFRTPPDAHHISLVMVHDVRPADMNGRSPQHALDPARIAEVQAKLRSVSAPAYTLSLYGLRFGRDDGAAMAVFVDAGETNELRRRIASAIGPHLGEYARKHAKPFIHTTLLRPLDQILDGRVIEQLKSVQRAWFDVRSRRLDVFIDEFELGHEVVWQHGRVERTKRYPLSTDSSV